MYIDRKVSMKKRFKSIICFILLAVLLIPQSVSAANISTTTLKEIYRYAIRYADAKPGGIVLAGSSSLSRWTSAPEQIASCGVFSEEQVYNFGISGATFQELLDTRYINAIAAAKPSVIVVYGANSLTASRRKASRNRSVANRATNATIKFIEKTRQALKRQGVTGTRFLYVSAVKTPFHYKICKGKGYTCNIWKRIDILNSRMRKYAAAVSYCDYMDTEQYYYYALPGKKNKSSLRFYLGADTLQDSTSTAAAKALIRKAAVDPLFAADLRHPSKLAYELIWSKVAEQASHLKQI